MTHFPRVPNDHGLYTPDVVNLHVVEIERLREAITAVADRCKAVPIGAPCFHLADGLLRAVDDVLSGERP